MVEVLTALAPSLISVVVFGVYMVIEKGLTPARAYTVLSLLNLLQVLKKKIKRYLLKPL
jgi:hypothetical protein